MAQSVEYLTLDFSPGHDLRVVGSTPVSGSTKCRDCLRFSLSLLHPLSLAHLPSFSKKEINTLLPEKKNCLASSELSASRNLFAGLGLCLDVDSC